MTKKKASPLEHRRAMSIEEFADSYGIGRTTIYEQIKAGRLAARKVGRRTVITALDAERWLNDLPMIGGQA